MDDDLLCDETWLSYNNTDHDDDDPNMMMSSVHHVLPPMRSSSSCSDSGFEFEFENIDIVEAFHKEISLLPQPHFINYLHSHHLISPRFRLIQWFLKCRSRYNLSFGTVFYAVNYLDRFVSICQYSNDWKYWMVELLSITCLSIATKFNEIYSISLDEIQMVEGLEYSYESKTILRVELILLKALDWRLNTVTSYSFVEMIACNIQSLLRPHVYEKLISRVTQLILQATLDQKMMEFRQSMIGISALWCSIDKFDPSISDTFISYIMVLLNQSQKEDLIECHKRMEITSALVGCGQLYYYPSSPTTVLLKD